MNRVRQHGRRSNCGVAILVRHDIARERHGQRRRRRLRLALSFARMLLLPLVDRSPDLARLAVLPPPPQRVEDPVLRVPHPVRPDAVDEEEREAEIGEGEGEVDDERAPAVRAEELLEPLREAEIGRGGRGRRGRGEAPEGEAERGGRGEGAKEQAGGTKGGEADGGCQGSGGAEGGGTGCEARWK